VELSYAIKTFLKTRFEHFNESIYSFIHTFIQAISIALLQVHYHSEALPTQHGYCVGVSRRIAQATAKDLPKVLRGA